MKLLATFLASVGGVHYGSATAVVAEDGVKPGAAKQPENEDHNEVQDAVESALRRLSQAKETVARFDQKMLDVLTARLTHWKPAQRPPKRRSSSAPSTALRLKHGSAWLASMQQTDGRWGDDAANAYCAMWFLGADRSDRIAANARVWFDFERLCEGDLQLAPRARAGESQRAKPLALAVIAECSDQLRLEHRAKARVSSLAQQLLNAQDADGRWRARNTDASGHPITTAWAYLALLLAHEHGISVELRSSERWEGEGPGVRTANAWRKILASLDAECLSNAESDSISGLFNAGEFTRGAIALEETYLATLALKRVGGDSWERWRTVVRTRLQESQRDDGSWGSGASRRRVVDTALALLCLRAVESFD